MTLLRFVLTRLAWMVPTFLAMTVLTFAVAHLAPGDPLQLSESGGVSGAVIDAARQQQGLDRPLAGRYLRWLANAARLDLGRSAIDHVEVTTRIREALPRTVLVSGLSLLVALLVAIPLGSWLGARDRRPLSRLVGAALTLASAVPSFWVAVMALLLLATPRGVMWFPFQGLGESNAGALEVAWHLVLPVTCLAWPLIAWLTSVVRSGVAESLEQDFVRAARGRGLSERRVLFRHALPNALLPVVTVVGLQLPHVVAGSVVIERVFGIGGMGSMAFEAIGTRDYPVVMGVATVMAGVTLLSMLLTDLAYAVIDPRVRLTRPS